MRGWGGWSPLKQKEQIEKTEEKDSDIWYKPDPKNIRKVEKEIKKEEITDYPVYSGVTIKPDELVVHPDIQREVDATHAPGAAKGFNLYDEQREHRESIIWAQQKRDKKVKGPKTQKKKKEKKEKKRKKQSV
jgi:hypothetical protein